jgi:hypothetical protein
MASPQEEFVHPVIEAMLGAYDRIQKAKNTKFEQGLQQKKSDLEQTQFDELKRIHDLEEKHANEQHDINLQTLALTKRQHSLDVTNLVNKFISEGGKGLPMPDTQLPGMENALGQFGQVSLPNNQQQIPNSDVTFDPSGYSTPQEQADRTAQAAGAITKAQAQSLEPFKQAEDTRKFTQAQNIADTTFGRELTVHAADRAAQERIATANRASQERIAELNARTRFGIAKMGLDSNDPAIDNYVNDMYITGNTANIPTNVKLQGAIRGAVPKGWTPLSKTDVTQLDGISLVDNLIAKSRQLATQGSGVLGRAGAATGLGEAGNTAQEVEALLGNVARVFGGEKGVLTQKDVDRAKGLIYSPLQTKEKNLEKAQQLEDLFNDKIGKLVSKYPQDQRDALLSKREIDPQRFNKNTASPSTPKSGNTAIQLEDGTVIPDTPQNRRLHNLPLE